MNDTTTRLSVNVNRSTKAELDLLAERNHVTYTETIRRAVAVYKLLDEARAHGETILVGNREVVLL